MSAYMIVHATVKDLDKYKAYAEAAGPTLKSFGVEILFKGKVTDILTGEHEYKMSVVMKFPDQLSINEWYDSDEYQAIIPLGETAANVVFIAVE